MSVSRRASPGNGVKRRGRPSKNAQTIDIAEPKKRHFSAAARRRMAEAVMSITGNTLRRFGMRLSYRNMFSSTYEMRRRNDGEFRALFHPPSHSRPLSSGPGEEIGRRAASRFGLLAPQGSPPLPIRLHAFRDLQSLFRRHVFSPPRAARLWWVGALTVLQSRD